MTQIERLKTLVEHWIEHNDEHEETYRQWEEQLKTMGYDDLSQSFNKICTESAKLNKLFKDTLDLIEEKI
ncbi:MAG: hypothetical protein L3V56_06725 [Candidatus Magnetoovum sp. WYHC-5]|nr:hypothetical protein [Candidatus Magnetoovum sp. WYHC-5]